MKKPLFLSRTYFPNKKENRMLDVGNVEKARSVFLRDKPSNLSFLLSKRYSWMNYYITPEEKGIEVGAGHGLSELYIKSGNFILTDYEKSPWIDEKVDALDMPYEDSCLDYIISSNMIHHLAQPYKFFCECSRVLKTEGKLIIQEINCSLMMRIILKIMQHEGYSYDIDVFDETTICNVPSDPWSANCAIPNLLFDDSVKFEQNFPFKMIHHNYAEFIIFPLSGGVIAKSRTINLPRLGLMIIDKIDSLLIRLSKNIFPLQRQIVLINRK